MFYVDDVVIIGNIIGYGDVWWLDCVLRRFGFVLKVEKVKVFRKVSVKMVIG